MYSKSWNKNNNNKNTTASHDKGRHEYVTRQPFFLLSVAKERTTMAAPWLAQIRTRFFCININRTTTRSYPIEMFAHFWRFEANLRLRLPIPLNASACEAFCRWNSAVRFVKGRHQTLVMFRCDSQLENHVTKLGGQFGNLEPSESKFSSLLIFLERI